MIENEYRTETRPLTFIEHAQHAADRMAQSERVLRPAVVQALAFLVLVLGAVVIWRVVEQPDVAFFIIGVLVVVAVVQAYNVLAN